jgi:hypothetical protein
MKRKRGLEPSPKYDFSGGLVTMVAKTRLFPNQLIKARNVNILVDGEVEMRGGCTKVSTVSFGGVIDRFFHFKTDTYDKLFAWGGTNLKRLDVGSPDVWTNVFASAEDTDDFRSMEIAQEMLYIGNINSYGVRKYYPGQSVTWRDGITAPTTKCNRAISGAGNLLGTYQWYYTYYNSITDEESNPSPISDELTITAPAQQVTLSGFIASTDAQVDKIRIYRNTSGVSQYFRVGEKPNTTADYIDNMSDNDVGVEISFLNNIPPASGIFLWHMNRMFYVDADHTSDLYWSEAFKPGSVPPVNKIVIERGDGGHIINLLPCYDNIVVFKNTGVYLFIFDAIDPTKSTYQVISARYGSAAAMSAVNIHEDIVFLSPEGLKKIINGGTLIQDIVVPVQSEYGTREIPPINNIFRECQKDVLARAVGVYYEDKNQYHLSIPYYASINNTTVVWHMDSNAFTIHDGWTIKAGGNYKYYDSELLYYSHADEYIYRHDYGSDDDGNEIEFEVQTGWHDVNGIPDRKHIRLFFPVIFGAENAVISYEILKEFETPLSGFVGTIQHLGASYFGYAHWGHSYWGLGGEIIYRIKALVKGKVFSVRFFASTKVKVGVAGYQFFYQPRAL